MRKLSYIFGLLLIASSLLAQNYFSGTIERDTRWIGDIYINGDVIVPRGVILSIESGSRILFKPKTDVQRSGIDRERAELIINGVLLAKGTSSQSPIVFTSEASNAQMNDWYGIEIKNLNERSDIQNSIIEFGYKGILCYGSAPRISNSEIRFNYNSGISAEVRAKPEIDNCVIMGNGFAGINCELASSPVVNECVITQNTYGVIVFSRSEPDLGRYPAEENRSTGQNRIFNNFDFDVYNHSAVNIYAQNNFWNTSNADEIRLTLYDNAQNPSYGQVIFEPIFLQRRRRRPSIPPIALNDRQTLNQPAVADTQRQQFPPADTSELPSTDTVLANAFTPPETTATASPETVFVFREPEKQPETVEPQMQEPILEAFLDSGKREYLQRALPKYPDIYLKTGTEGEVYIEVVVGRNGEVEDYRVLRSGGELFSDAAIRALQKYRYKPGTFQGKPIKFKVVELFRFRRNNP